MSILTAALSASCLEIKRHADLLDRINVFPVMDGDTGTNMSSTLDGLFCSDDCSDGINIANLIRSASGNSGIILSQFVAGFVESMRQSYSHSERQVSFQDIVQAAECGKKRAYASVMHPKEGTILSAMACFSDVLSNHRGPFDINAHSSLIARVMQCVVETKEIIPKLKSANVVDSGALGFLLFSGPLSLIAVSLIDREVALRKIRDVATGGSVVSLSSIESSIAPKYIEDSTVDEEKKYCINLLIDARSDVDPALVFKELGDSANTARDGRLIKVHLHADDKDAVLLAASHIGEVVDVKVQDMHAALFSRKAESLTTGAETAVRFRLVTDSSVSLDRTLAAKEGILIVDNTVHVNGRKLADRHVNLSELMMGMRSRQVFKTAQVTPDEASQFLQDALRCSEHVIYIGVGKAYTGTQESIRKAAAAFSKERVVILDSHAASGQLGAVCLAVQRFSKKASGLREIIEYAEQQIASCKEYLVIDDLQYLRRTGRIGRIRAAFAAALSVKPIVGHGDAGAITIAKVRSREAAIDEIIRRSIAHPGMGEYIAIVEYTDNVALAETIKCRLAEVLPLGTEILLCPLSSATAVHMGPGTFGVSVTRL
jgi:DegV family protein with EDD domain